MSEWTVRAIYAAYLGWSDGNPTHLHPLPPEEKAVKTIALMGGSKSVLGAAKEAPHHRGVPVDIRTPAICFLDSAQEVTEAKALKASALRYLAEYGTSANGRHYYLRQCKGINRISPMKDRQEMHGIPNLSFAIANFMFSWHLLIPLRLLL